MKLMDQPTRGRALRRRFQLCRNAIVAEVCGELWGWESRITLVMTLESGENNRGIRYACDCMYFLDSIRSASIKEKAELKHGLDAI
jgi:hypothetical protein